MDEIPEVDVEAAKSHLDAGDALFVDIRDPGSYGEAHVPGATHIGDHNVQQFVNETDPDQRVIVYCYHGHSSLGAVAYFREHGLENVASMRGGFEGWRGRHPHEGGAG